MKSKIVLILLIALAAGEILSGQSNKKKITIDGIVVDANQNPVANATIMIDNKKTSTITDQNGSYTIKVKSSAKKVGIFTDKTGVIEEPLEGRTTINFTLNIAANQRSLNQKNPNGEEEINIGYGTAKKKDLSQQVNKIDGRNNRYATYTNIYEMIKGEVPGVRVNGTSINIQGSASFISNTEPLIVVDGIPTESIDNISPQNVKSIEVLKGAAAAIYGSRGANGVILIDLIRGKDKK